MNKDYAMNTTVSLVLPVTTKVRLLDECQRRVISNQANTSLSDVIREGIERLLQEAEEKAKERKTNG